MATFYPINTPLINYFFYKAPFINDAYSLTNLTVLAGGSGYAVNDIVILDGGTYTNPAVIKVTGVTSGEITSFDITSNGKYSVSPTTLTQLSTNGVGTGTTFNGLAFTPNLYPIGPNVPLSGGFIYFYEDENRTVQANTYSDVSDSSNPVINTNPIQLGTSGDFPPIYMEDRFYYIVITDNTGDQANPVEVLEHYNPSEVVNQPSAFNDNFVVNPQFNYPITFYKTTDEEGEITDDTTIVAWGWEFLQDEETDSKNYITFEDVVGQGIEGNPIKQIILNCEDASSEETLKDFRSYIGKVDFYSGQSLTFSAQMISLRLVPAPVKIFIELFYGIGGSPTELIELTSFTVGVTRQKFVHSFSVPSIDGKLIGTGNYMAIRIQPSINAVCLVGITNVLVAPGVQPSAIFNNEATGYSKALILGESTDISGAGLIQNYSSYYYNDGKIFPYSDTGTIFLQPKNEVTPYRLLCDGSSLLVNGYSDTDIPYRRLYDVIGLEFGGGGDIICGVRGKEVSFESAAGARAKTAYTAGTTTFAVANPFLGLDMGINIVNNNDYSVTATFVDNFAADQTVPNFFGSYTFLAPSSLLPQAAAYWGTGGGEINAENITINTTAPGSVSTQAVFDLTFHSKASSDYQTRQVSSSNQLVVSSFLEFSALSPNSRQPGGYGGDTLNHVVLFSLDGVFNIHIGMPAVFLISSNAYTVVDFKSNLSITQNIKNFVKTVANPFLWTITVNNAPSASQYFLFSSATVDYYGWFTVNGVGVDPAIGSRTGVEIPTFTGNTPEDVARIIAETINSQTFTIPAPADLPALVTDSKVSWFINL
jgi:hypothetical protein